MTMKTAWHAQAVFVIYAFSPWKGLLWAFLGTCRTGRDRSRVPVAQNLRTILRSYVCTMKRTGVGKRLFSIDEVVYRPIVTTRTGQRSEIDDREVGEHAYIEHWICEKVHDCSDSQSAQSIIFCSRHRSMSTLSFDWQSYDLKPASDSTALVTM